MHITPTTLRPDIVWWSDVEKQLWLFELTVSYETAVADAALWNAKCDKNRLFRIPCV